MRRLVPFWLLGVLLGAPAYAQIDTTVAGPPPDTRTPRGALWRAAAVPGWGQLYNRQYLKIPVVYAGLGGLTTMALYTNSQYLRYRHAFLYKVYQEQVEQGTREENPWSQYEDVYQQLINDKADGRPVASSNLRTGRDKLRRNRDLLYFGIGLWYGLSLLDAYVSAHLFDFDVGEDLSVHFYPHPQGPAATLRWAL